MPVSRNDRSISAAQEEHLIERKIAKTTPTNTVLSEILCGLFLWSREKVTKSTLRELLLTKVCIILNKVTPNAPLKIKVNAISFLLSNGFTHSSTLSKKDTVRTDPGCPSERGVQLLESRDNVTP